MVSFSPESLPPVSLRHNGRLIRLQEAQRRETDFLCWFSWADTAMVLRGWIFPWVCVSGVHKNPLLSFFFHLIVASRTNLAACLAVKHVNQPRLKRRLRCQLLLSCVSPHLPSFHLDVIFPRPSNSQHPPLKIGLSAHTPLHKLNSPLQALTGLSAYESASPGFIQAEKVGVEKLPFHKQKLLKRYHLNTVFFLSGFAAAGVVENNRRTLDSPSYCSVNRPVEGFVLSWTYPHAAFLFSHKQKTMKGLLPENPHLKMPADNADGSGGTSTSCAEIDFRACNLPHGKSR